MAEYINREALLERLKFKRDNGDLNRKKYSGLESAIAQVKKSPVADVVEVVRCRECKNAIFQYNDYKFPFGLYACKKQPAGRAYKKVRGDFWCAYGERKDGAGE